ncbi:hypothetical protein COW36_11380 [bacterium (Candidatus Blackallbacteria) CG17_big_fil_post_rev_8_21_14_2_50_48_46]|uniref:Uncharacterized protein n=1 Tax=bacterium (Candidatus Blackallbacteria) CG17_big_fil_post_rev_8_21_14_2_50_48_46 TaxID=2014261 RepID=A0A2M7G4N7_9BACT|nr:MAG: hypothetical protein COW64_18475 [bacterium (Candidatus Blackallbacteria) CG18_big_fil_WC_8_21_14_2_50_49_26]PIW16876.1 MAG: hypothetical protein COW36_11380 [bacterium (Candidatus Blackallbacteria) CG17_big_fil_post_rev_8_21_14_2_50_48_46]PIW48073.1 MAG: hypothetical protein COW20_11095 [bacterium (Candidatus Blackallbacteria) CG13_big_fil_rev_8_21_14_2_50_49_14]
MFVKLQESLSTHLQLSFHLSSRWLKEHPFFSLQLPLPSETASEQLEPTMRQALHFWLQDQPNLLCEQPELRLKGQDFPHILKVNPFRPLLLWLKLFQL